MMFPKYFLTGGLFLACAATLAHADQFPNRALTIVVPFSAGGAIDQSTRIVAKEVANQLGQSIVVDNRSGASGAIGAQAVARAKPDGYTLLAGSPGTMTAPVALKTKIPYDPVESFSPVSLVITSPNVLVANLDLPASNVKELLMLARERGSTEQAVSYASAGIGSSLHIGGAMFAALGDVNLLHVPYKGTSQAMTDLMAGHVDLIFSDASALSHVKSGKLKALAVTSKERSKLHPEIPTIAEGGIPNYDMSNWHGWFAPAGTPEAVIQTLNDAIGKALSKPEVIQQLADASMEASTDASAAYMADYQKETIRQWSEIAEQAGIVAE